MRLNKTHKKAFVRAVMDDVPRRDFIGEVKKLLQAEAAKVLPSKVRAVWNDPELRGFVETSSYYTRIKPLGSSHGMTISIPTGTFSLIPDSVKDQALEIAAQSDAEKKRLEELKLRLEAAIAHVSTRKKLAELFPEFEKYLPAEEEKTENLPAITGVVGAFVEAGWKGAEQQGGAR